MLSLTTSKLHLHCIKVYQVWTTQHAIYIKLWKKILRNRDIVVNTRSKPNIWHIRVFHIQRYSLTACPVLKLRSWLAHRCLVLLLNEDELRLVGPRWEKPLLSVETHCIVLLGTFHWLIVVFDFHSVSIHFTSYYYYAVHLFFFLKYNICSVHVVFIAKLILLRAFYVCYFSFQVSFSFVISC